jgi:hypothetical protein
MNKLDILGYTIIAGLLVVCIYIYFDSKDELELKCIISKKDGNTYCVRERKELDKAANLLATITEKCKALVKYMDKKYPDQDNVRRLVAGYNPKAIEETLPTSAYTAYSENKGEKLAFCLNVKKADNDHLIDENTLMFVAIHEMSHIATKSIGHKNEFWDNFKFLLENAKEAGIHDPQDYKKKPQEYCGMTIKDNPYYDA